MNYSKKSFAPFHDKEVIHCKYCDFPISNPGFYPGKKLMVNRYCPKCHYVNTYLFLKSEDQRFLRAGFFSNPLYPIHASHLSSVPFKVLLLFYPFSVLVNFALNIFYMPFGIFKNNLEMRRTKKLFYLNYSTEDLDNVYFDQLRKGAADQNPYAAYVLGLAYLEGVHVSENLQIAEEFLTVAKDSYEEELVAFGKKLLQRPNPDYPKIFLVLNLVRDNPHAGYFLAYLYFYGYGIVPSLKQAKMYAKKAEELRIKDTFTLYPKIKEA